jgi:hypothetical protein
MAGEPGSVGVGGAIGLARLLWDASRWALRKCGLVATPTLCEPVAAHGNLPGENHVLWQIPVEFRRWGLADTRADYTVHLRWHYGPITPYQMTFAGGRRPEASEVLRPTITRVVPIVIHSLVGETVRLSTDPSIAPVEAPKDKARLLDLGVFWNMASERVDFPPGKHWLTLELRVGQEQVASGAYRLEVPRSGEDNSRLVLARAGEGRAAA